MNKIVLLLSGLAFAGSVAAEDCTAPASPSLPDGGSATMEQMLEGQKAVKTFQAANLEYMGCLEARFTAAEAAAKKGSDEDKASAQAQYNEAMDAYNAAVSEEEKVAGQFNTEIREYKAANPG
jgi:hypothetical protein